MQRGANFSKRSVDSEAASTIRETVAPIQDLKTRQAKSLNRCGRIFCDMAKNMSSVIDDMKAADGMDAQGHVPKLRQVMDETMGPKGTLEKFLETVPEDEKDKAFMDFIGHETTGTFIRSIRDYMKSIEDANDRASVTENLMFTSIMFKGICKNAGVMVKMERFVFDTEMGHLYGTESIKRPQDVIDKQGQARQMSIKDVLAESKITYSPSARRWEDV